MKLSSIPGRLATGLVVVVAMLGAAHAQPAVAEHQALRPPTPKNQFGAVDSSLLMGLPPDMQAKLMAWVAAESARMPKAMPQVERNALLQTVWYESQRAGLSAEVVLAVIDVSSRFRKYFIGADDARGYMGVGAHWPKELSGGDVDNLFVMQVNLRYGCTLLRNDLDTARGNLPVALALYKVQQQPKRTAQDAGGVQGQKFSRDVLAALLGHWKLTDESSTGAASP